MFKRVLSGSAIILGVIFPLLAHANPLTIYTSRSEDLIMPLLDAFSAETGIETQILTDKEPQLIARLQSEGDASPADVFMPATVDNMQQAADLGLLMPVQSQILEDNIPQAYRDQNNQWFGLGKRARVIIYNLETVNPETDLSSYEALADEKWANEILVRSSSHPYNLSLMAALIAKHGEEWTEDWTSRLVNNLARPPQGGDRDQIRAVAEGEGKIAIANSYYYALMKNSDVPEEKAAAAATGIYFPNQNPTEGEISGTHINLSGAGIIHSTQNYDEALALIEFLSSPKAQELYSELNQEYPVNPKAQMSETLQSFGEFTEDSIAPELLYSYVDEALKISDRAGWR